MSFGGGGDAGWRRVECGISQLVRFCVACQCGGVRTAQDGVGEAAMGPTCHGIRTQMAHRVRTGRHGSTPFLPQVKPGEAQPWCNSSPSARRRGHRPKHTAPIHCPLVGVKHLEGEAPRHTRACPQTPFFLTADLMSSPAHTRPAARWPPRCPSAAWSS